MYIKHDEDSVVEVYSPKQEAMDLQGTLHAMQQQLGSVVVAVRHYRNCTVC